MYILSGLSFRVARACICMNVVAREAITDSSIRLSLEIRRG